MLSEVFYTHAELLVVILFGERARSLKKRGTFFETIRSISCVCYFMDTVHTMPCLFHHIPEIFVNLKLHGEFLSSEMNSRGLCCNTVFLLNYPTVDSETASKRSSRSEDELCNL